MKKYLLCFGSCILPFFLAFHSDAQPFTQSDTARLSFGTFTGATEANANVQNPKISKNGRFVVFESTATNLVDTSSGTYSGFTNINGTNRQIYLYDRQSSSLELISVNTGATNAAPMDCFDPVISADGRYVAYVATTTGAQATQMNSSIDGNLGDGNSCLKLDTCHVNYWVDGTHVWIRDRLANKNFLATQVAIPVNVQATENGVPQTTTVQRCPADCSSVACDESTQVETEIPVMETLTIRIAQGILISRSPLVINSASAANPSMGGDGQFIVYDSNSNYLAGYTDALLEDPVCEVDYNTSTNDGVLDSDYVGFPSAYLIDSNGTTRDVFVRDGEAFTNTIASFGCQFHAPNGCNLQGNQDAIKGTISDDGTKVAWQSASTNLLDLDFNSAVDIFLSSRSTLNGEISDLTRISNNTSRILAANAASTEAVISADGRYIAFQSAATNIVSSDTNTRTDIFIYDSSFFNTVRCISSSSVQGDGDSLLPDITGNGESVAFYSSATNFGASSGFSNAFVGTLSKDSSGKITGCSATLASPGATGTGANAAVTTIGVGIVPVSELQSDGSKIRRRVSAVAYQSLATNLHTGSADANNRIDIFQAPTCSATDASTDTDSDGTSDCFDQCWQDPIKVVDTDADSDGVADCEDGCTNDAQKTAPGECGCGVQDTDSDSDGTEDCNDECPNDAAKTEPGTCGCGQADVDADSNGTADCIQSTNPTATPGGPTATPTSGPSPTPSRTPTATPTITPIFVNITPKKPELRRATNKTLVGTLNIDGIPVLSVTRYEIDLTRRSGGTSSTKRRNISATNNEATFRRLRNGSYRIRFRARNSSNEVTRFSSYSNSVTIR